MEVYYKDLISEEATLEKLVDDLLQVVQGANELVEAAPEDRREEISSRLQRLKEGCNRIREQAIGGAQATDKVLREYPYWLAGAAFGLGVLAGALIFRNRCSASQRD
jgi:ElaB/YqjD/DUF883 family membrane-anchored ribosome-binding protein